MARSETSAVKAVKELERLLVVVLEEFAFPQPEDEEKQNLEGART